MQVQIAEQIRADVNSAMKAGDRDRAAALRLVLSELQKDAKEGAGDELAVLRRERKRRREAETAYREAERGDLAQTEAYEASIDRGLPPRGAVRRRARRAGGQPRSPRPAPSPRATWARRSST